MKITTNFVLSTLMFACFLGCSDNAPPDVDRAPIPVSTMTLEKYSPEAGMRIAGIAESWSEQDISFEVGGTLIYVAEVGEQYAGELDEGESLGVIARIDPEPYEIALAIAQSEVTSLELTIETVLPARFLQIEAELERTRLDYEKTREAYDRNAATQRDLAAAKAAFDSTQAQQAEAEAELSVQVVSLDRAKSQLRSAQRDLDNCTLYAPFPGELSELYVVAGGTVSAGTPIAHLTMMAPIMVRVSVSAENYRTLYENDTVLFYPPGMDVPQTARVYQKGVSADPATRTFQVTFISPNHRLDEPLAPDAESRSLPRIGGLMPVIDPLYHEHGTEENAYIETRRCLYHDEAGDYVWVVEGMTADTGLSTGDPSMTLSKLYITLGENRANYQGIFIFQEVLAPATLRPRMLIAAGVPDGFRDGGRAAWIRQRWLIQPGETVEVDLRGESPPIGFYVPFNATLTDTQGKAYLYILSENDTAEKVEIEIGASVGELVRIQSDVLEAGDRVVIRGGHLLQPGEQVSVTTAATVEESAR